MKRTMFQFPLPATEECGDTRDAATSVEFARHASIPHVLRTREPPQLPDDMWEELAQLCLQYDSQKAAILADGLTVERSSTGERCVRILLGKEQGTVFYNFLRFCASRDHDIPKRYDPHTHTSTFALEWLFVVNAILLGLFPPDENNFCRVVGPKPCFRPQKSDAEVSTEVTCEDSGQYYHGGRCRSPSPPPRKKRRLRRMKY